jgi:cellobiose phosphorylase
MCAVKTKLLSGTASGAGINIELLQTGDIRTITAGPVMINQLVGNYLDGMAGNIYLRIYDGKKITPWPLMGRASESTVTLSEDHVLYAGEAGGLRYRVKLFAAENLWFFDVRVEHPAGSAKPVRIDVVYTQDIGLAAWGHVRSNEAYNAQYIDHKVFTTDRGYVIASRQNQGQSTGFPFLQQGTLGGRAASFSVDGYPLYGLSYKFDNTIAELSAPVLNNRVYQYEYAFSALQTEPIDLGREGYETAFYGYFLPNIEGAVEGPVPGAEIEAVYTATQKRLFNSGSAGTKGAPLPRIH